MSACRRFRADDGLTGSYIFAEDSDDDVQKSSSVKFHFSLCTDHGQTQVFTDLRLVASRLGLPFKKPPRSHPDFSDWKA